jgi:hypothetical protein
LVSSLQDSSIVTIFVHRHPFDIALSLVDYVPLRHDHRLSGLMQRADSRRERIELALFGGVDDATGERLPSVSERLERHRGWLSSPGTTVVRFEDFRADDLAATEAIQRITAAIAPRVDPISLLPAAKLSRSATMNRGTAGRWRDELPPDLMERALETFAEELDAWGY